MFSTAFFFGFKGADTSHNNSPQSTTGYWYTIVIIISLREMQGSTKKTNLGRPTVKSHLGPNP